MSLSKRWLDDINEAEQERERIDGDECEHQYAEVGIAPTGVRCIHCGHFVGAWE